MKLHTLIRIGMQYQIGELELTLIPGLPQWQILGLPDQTFKEALVRVAAALREHGYEVPTAHKVLLQLHPSQIKKQSDGIDLAIALALLVETQQLPEAVLDLFSQYSDAQPIGSVNHEDAIVAPKVPPIVYGALTLGGDIHRPVDIGILGGVEVRSPVVTGSGAEETTPRPLRRSGYYALRTLADLRLLLDFWRPPQESIELVASLRPTQDEFTKAGIKFPVSAARAMMITAAGEHPTMVAGPSGQGKSTWVKGVTSVLPPLRGEAFEAVQKWGWRQGIDITQRPVVDPHHSASAVALLGGGNPPLPGEISRAHGGTLVLDEFLEFSPTVQEALREPMESGSIRLVRYGHALKFPARFLLLATTNLCACGEYVPIGRHKCRCRLTRRRQYLERLSGPLLDRFSLLLWCHEWQRRPITRQQDGWLQKRASGCEGEFSLAEIITFVDRAKSFAFASRKQIVANQRLAENQLLEMFDPFVLEKLLPGDGRSRRRRRALLSVSRTIADLEESDNISLQHIEEAAQWTLYSFYALQGFS